MKSMVFFLLFLLARLHACLFTSCESHAHQSLLRLVWVVAGAPSLSLLLMNPTRIGLHHIIDCSL